MSDGTLYTGISDGVGGFTYSYNLVTSGFTSVRVADFTGNGWASIFLYRATDGVAYLGVGDGTGGFTSFNPLSLSPGYDKIDIGDLNGDGKMDVVLYNSSNGNAAAGISNGVGSFTFNPLLWSPGFTSVAVSDYFGDGLGGVTLYNRQTASATSVLVTVMVPLTSSRCSGVLDTTLFSLEISTPMARPTSFCITARLGPSTPALAMETAHSGILQFMGAELYTRCAGDSERANKCP